MDKKLSISSHSDNGECDEPKPECIAEAPDMTTMEREIMDDYEAEQSKKNS